MKSLNQLLRMAPVLAILDFAMGVLCFAWIAVLCQGGEDMFFPFRNGAVPGFFIVFLLCGVFPGMVWFFGCYHIYWHCGTGKHYGKFLAVVLGTALAEQLVCLFLSGDFSFPCLLHGFMTGAGMLLLRLSAAVFGAVRENEIEALLEREPLGIDEVQNLSDLSGRTVLVTGGGGSIGSELCRQIAAASPGKLIVLDICENNVFALMRRLEQQFPNCPAEAVIASVGDEQRMEKIFSIYHPEYVFHAAAHKHVPLMEENAVQAVKNNVFGTYCTVRCASRFKVKRFVLISTDKAVNPTSVMGAAKRLCEMIVQAEQTVSETEFAAVRFGNVLNSNGSFLPCFRQQIEAGGPVTLTHREITRFFMTIPEAVRLVLCAARFAKDGEIFVLDMGEPVKIYDFAKRLIRLYGLRPEKDVKIYVTGLRPGEKLFEELLLSEEGLKKTAHDRIFVGKPHPEGKESLNRKLRLLKEAVETEENEKVRRALAAVVPEYHYDSE